MILFIFTVDKATGWLTNATTSRFVDIFLLLSHKVNNNVNKK